ncbi:hypothetical protein MCOR25_002966 [Pyricularia grisea]|uniref:Arabinosidase n=1 Tax=Pyricularia grisea TaxID=148305 RepID=A0A6P8AUR5_PYRGI|nr:uncharacterized protein PgNI_08772 [Pyricularia grisea]KAI6375400.1 hypothetical protein MCOR25_002966 [Pyricularia grisea]TLD05952.1 hypothetical protein PgNI_08772 [Pyricularia grisea]
MRSFLKSISLPALGFILATALLATPIAADSSLVGYLGAFFLGDEPSVYFYLSNGNNALSFSPMNKGAAVIKPTKGTGGVRDPNIVTGGGNEEGKKWYIIGTDLDINKTTWDLSQRNGSRGILVWESTDLVNWTNERLVTVEDDTAGMVWAPEALWDASMNQYMVHWASKFYKTSDPGHTGAPSSTVIRYAHTSDFITFTAPKTYIDLSPTDVIDLAILPVPNSDGRFIRFLKDETRKTVFVEYGYLGLHGNFTRDGGNNATIDSGVEGPAPFWDNKDPYTAHLLLDHYDGDGYWPYENAVNPAKNTGWSVSDRSDFPKNLRHGSVLPINQTLYDNLKSSKLA